MWYLGFRSLERMNKGLPCPYFLKRVIAYWAMTLPAKFRNSVLESQDFLLVIDDVAFCGMYPYHGTIQRYKVHSARYVHKLPDTISFRNAASIEPLSVALHALRTTPIDVGTPVAVFGAGPIGLLVMAVARASGAHPVVITDVDASRLEFAKEFEPHCRTYLVNAQGTAQGNAVGIRSLFAGSNGLPTEHDMPALVLECTGIESSIATAAYIVRRGGRINIVGVSSRPLINNIPFMHLSLAEIQLRFIKHYTGTWPAAIQALEGALIDPEKLTQLVSHEFCLEEAIKAMELVSGSAGSRERVVKVQITDYQGVDESMKVKL
ncbi:hypothetical protein INS49_015638 [Diaporthe citri]|uniref:uncharacterized protein n=1 Tax=Diaporthe citri TaxID=83186 RepID=UPI001C7EDB96|nr:uncharacterized protein INS49_015638 [Diaporthe citri]KAG6356251.1 hypothetical protein INS49_015638 [Diaporthe citri]